MTITQRHHPDQHHHVRSEDILRIIPSSSAMPDVQCTFESEDHAFCNWVTMANAFGIMSVGSAVEEGPPFDHTLGNEAGHYTYLHSLDTFEPTATAKASLYTKAPLSSFQICVDFWYLKNINIFLYNTLCRLFKLLTMKVIRYHMNGETKKKLTLQAAVGAQHIGQLHTKYGYFISLSQIQLEISTRFVSSLNQILLLALRMELIKSTQLLTTAWKIFLTKHPS